MANAMTKQQVEQGLWMVLFLPRNITEKVKHTGNHHWETGMIEIMQDIGGMFAGLFSHVEIKITTKPFDAEWQDFSQFRIDVKWYYRKEANGTANGTYLDYYFRHSTVEFLNLADAVEVVKQR